MSPTMVPSPPTPDAPSAPASSRPVTPAGSESYRDRRAWIAEYFDRTASRAWTALTSDAPVSGVRQKVRLGRERMGRTLLAWLPEDLTGMRILDAGCGPGVLAMELATRGADVVAVDLAGSLLEVARARLAQQGALKGRVELRLGDMLDPALGTFDYVVAMDSLIHYQAPDMLRALGQLAERTRRAMVVTFAPRTPMLAVMHAVGRAFPRRDRAPAIEPVSESRLREGFSHSDALAGWQIGRTQRIASSFYTSQALELRCIRTESLASTGAR
ncbi:MAG: magnesium protoporphyrin IX methyltransferase [Gemmatimonadaceae bacterium]